MYNIFLNCRIIKWIELFLKNKFLIISKIIEKLNLSEIHHLFNFHKKITNFSHWVVQIVIFTLNYLDKAIMKWMSHLSDRYQILRWFRILLPDLMYSNLSSLAFDVFTLLIILRNVWCWNRWFSCVVICLR